MSHRDNTMTHCTPDLEHPFPREEYQARLTRIRERMSRESIQRFTHKVDPHRQGGARAFLTVP